MNKKIKISLLIGICLVVVVGGFFFIKERNRISIEDSLVKELYSRIEPYFIPEIYPDFASYGDSHFYMDKRVTYNDLSDESRLYYAYSTIDTVERRWFTSCSDLKTYSFNKEDLYELCISSNEEMITKDKSSEEWFFNTVNKKTLEEAYKKMYGEEKEMPLKDFTMSFAGACVYSKENDDYICFNQTGGDTTVDSSSTKIEKAYKKKDSIEIYDRYLWITYTSDKENNIVKQYSKSRFKEKIFKKENVEKMETSATDALYKKGALYKHTFLKNSDGSYYWESSERVK